MKQYFTLLGTYDSLFQFVEWMIAHKVPFVEIFMLGRVTVQRGENTYYWGSRRSFVWLENIMESGFASLGLNIIVRDSDADMMLLAQIAFSDCIRFDVRL